MNRTPDQFMTYIDKLTHDDEFAFREAVLAGQERRRGVHRWLKTAAGQSWMASKVARRREIASGSYNWERSSRFRNVDHRAFSEVLDDIVKNVRQTSGRG